MFTSTCSSDVKIDWNWEGSNTFHSIKLEKRPSIFLIYWNNSDSPIMSITTIRNTDRTHKLKTVEKLDCKNSNKIYDFER